MIIDASYFVTGELYLSQVGDGASATVNNNDRLQSFIDEYEAEIMIYGLGRKLYEEFLTTLDINGKVKAGQDQKWFDLKDGVEYTKNGDTYYWKGLTYTKGSLKKSLIAYYVYYYYMLDDINDKTSLGVVKGRSKNTTAASPTPTLVKAWRNMRALYGECTKGNYSVTTYKGVVFEDYYGENATGEVSLYQFLYDHKDNYPDWSFTELPNMNQFSL